MSTRLMKVEEYSIWNEELWEVLTPDLREQEFQGTYAECLLYMRNNCPNGSCEE